jgi:predicted ATPase
MADGITRIAVEGFKSIATKQSIDIAPLTILAGANSSGKSSIMQPLLMLKQTLEQTFDPGPLWIGGPNVHFTSADQFLPQRNDGGPVSDLALEISLMKAEFDITFRKGSAGMEVLRERSSTGLADYTLRPKMTSEEIEELVGRGSGSHFDVVRNRFLLSFRSSDGLGIGVTAWIEPIFRKVIHVPGLRGTRSRTYPATAIGPSFPGTFDYYVASVIAHWQSERSAIADALNQDLRYVGLSQKVVANRLNDTEIELQVSRLAEAGGDDLLNIVDVGFGVSQTLPVLVALRAAGDDHLVYLEEPEIHLHPRAQTKLADILADAAKRGVRVVAETHSSLLLTAIQTLVAKGELDPKLVKLHWFQRDPKTGITQVCSADLDENGAFGDWPEDFGAVGLDSAGGYLDAVEGRQVR